MRWSPLTRGSVLISALGALFCIALVLLVALPLHAWNEAFAKQATARVDETSRTGAIAIERQLTAVTSITSSYVRTLQAPLSSGADVADPNGEVRAQLEELQRSNGDIGSVGLLSPTGLMLANQPWRQAAIGTSRSDRPFYQSAVKTASPTVSGIIFARAPGEPHIVVVAQAIYRTNTTELIGILATSIDASRAFQTWVNGMRDSHGVSLSVFDSHGSVVARPGMGNELITSMNPRIVGQQRGQRWAGTETLNNKPAFSAYVPIPAYGWTVRASVPVADGLVALDALRLREIGVAALLTLLGGLWLLRHVLGKGAQAQQSLNQTEERMREVIESAEQMFIEVDRNGRITEWNRKAEETLGWTRKEVLGSAILEIPGFIPSSQRANAERGFSQLAAMTDEQSWRHRLETVVLRKEASDTVYIEISMWTTHTGGELRLAALMQDVTARKRFEAERESLVKQQNRLVNELRQTDKSKSDFVSTVSHELRTPLTSIVGYLEMLREGFGGDLSEQQISMLQVVDRNSRRLLSLIEDLLTLSRIEAGTFRVELVDVKVASLLAGVLQAMIPSANDASLQIEVDVAEDTGTVRGDANQLERALLNDVSNAIKFTPENGRVTVHAFRQEDSVHISIQDTGIGIAVEEQARLFTRFFRAPDAQARAIQGTGLGLTIVKSIIDRHGGEVSLQSAFGVGTTVNITLPSSNRADILASH